VTALKQVVTEVSQLRKDLVSPFEKRRNQTLWELDAGSETETQRAVFVRRYLTDPRFFMFNGNIAKNIMGATL
jgi:hypothetical protein